MRGPRAWCDPGWHRRAPYGPSRPCSDCSGSRHTGVCGHLLGLGASCGDSSLLTWVVTVFALGGSVKPRTLSLETALTACAYVFTQLLASGPGVVSPLFKLRRGGGSPVSFTASPGTSPGRQAELRKYLSPGSASPSREALALRTPCGGAVSSPQVNRWHRLRGQCCRRESGRGAVGRVRAGA